MSKQLPPHHVIAEQWEEAAAALEPALAAWRAVSPDGSGPITELLHSARWNAAAWRHRSHGLARPDAWRAADGEVGPIKFSYINYDPEDVSEEEDR